MAVRFDASGDALSRTTNLPTASAFTLMGWFYRSVDRNAFECQLAFGDSTGGSYINSYVINSSDLIYLYNGNSGFSSGLNFTVGTWRHIAITSNGGASGLLLYVDGVLVVTTTQQAAVSAEKLWIGNNNDSEFWNGRAACVKIYDAVLTAAEIQLEMLQYVPFRFTNLNSWYPLLSTANDESDFSANGRTLTVGGTLASEEGPPIPWILDEEDYSPYVVSGGGGGTTVTLSALVANVIPVAPVVSTGVTLTSNPLVGNVTPAAPVVSTGVTLTPNPLTGTGVIATQVITVGNTILLSPLSLRFDSVNPVVSYGNTITLSSVSVTGVITTNTVVTGVLITLVPLNVNLVSIAPVVTYGNVVTLTAVAGRGVIQSPICGASIEVAFSPLLTSVIAVSLVVGVGVTLTLTPLSSRVVAVSPLVNYGNLINLSPLNVNFDLINVVVNAGGGSSGQPNIFMSSIFKSPIFGE